MKAFWTEIEWLGVPLWDETAILLGSTGNVLFGQRHEVGVKTSSVDKFTPNFIKYQSLWSQRHSPFPYLVYFSFCYLYWASVRGRAFQTDASIPTIIQSDAAVRVILCHRSSCWDKWGFNKSHPFPKIIPGSLTTFLWKYCPWSFHLVISPPKFDGFCLFLYMYWELVP